MWIDYIREEPQKDSTYSISKSSQFASYSGSKESGSSNLLNSDYKSKSSGLYIYSIH